MGHEIPQDQLVDRVLAEQLRLAEALVPLRQAVAIERHVACAPVEGLPRKLVAKGGSKAAIFTSAVR